MNENINLTKILKGCPKGFELYSTVLGEVKFVKCIGLHRIFVKKEGEYYYFTQEGVFIFQEILFKGECVLFPSKDQRDWSKFTAPWYKKEKSVELKESDDEKIKTAILNHLKIMWGNCQDDVCGVHVEDAIDWLEKQGKQKKQVHFPKFTFYDVLALQCCMETVKKVQEDKELYEQLNLIHSKMYDAYWLEKQCKNSTDKIEPKFKVGDWITINKPCQIVNINDNGNYIVQYWDDEKTHELSKNFCESYFHFWTIQDAKDGDVICYKDEISLYKNDIKNCTKQETKFGGFVYYCCYYGKRFITNSFYLLTEQDKIDIHPATKEQRDTLMKAMNYAGYEWDAEKKELKKLVEPNVSDKKEKFDPKTLKPFDKVLIRRSSESYNVWFTDFVGNPPKDINDKTLCMCVMQGITMVIPYNDDTQHLVGTNDEAPEYYRYWE